MVEMKENMNINETNVDVNNNNMSLDGCKVVIPNSINSNIDFDSSKKYVGHHTVKSSSDLNHTQAASLGSTTTSDLCEMIDNSIDAGATNIVMIFDGRNLTITDNGCGMSAHDICELYFNLGTSLKGCYDNKIGFFGRGGQYGALNLAKMGSSIMITSTKNGYKTVDVNWPKKSKCTMEYDIDIRDVSLQATGTSFSFVVDDLKAKELNNDKKRSELLNEIGINYCETIKSGIQISFEYKGVKTYVEAIDPLYSDSEYTKAHLKTANVIMPVTEDYNGQIVRDCAVRIDMVGFNADSINVNEHHLYDDNLVSTDTTGFYIYTEDGKRMIGFIQYSKALSRVSHTDYNGVRFKIYAPKPLWKDFGVQSNKIIHKIKFDTGIFNQDDDTNSFNSTIKKMCDDFKRFDKEKVDTSDPNSTIAKRFRKYETLKVTPIAYAERNDEFFVKDEDNNLTFNTNQQVIKHNAGPSAVVITAVLDGVLKHFGNNIFTYDNLKDYLLSNEFVETLK